MLQCCSFLFMYTIRSYYRPDTFYSSSLKLVLSFFRAVYFFIFTRTKKRSSPVRVYSALMASGWISIISWLKSSCFKFNLHLQYKSTKAYNFSLDTEEGSSRMNTFPCRGLPRQLNSLCIRCCRLCRQIPLMDDRRASFVSEAFVVVGNAAPDVCPAC